MLAPTAVHAVVEVHDTPARVAVSNRLGLGVVWTDQVVPFQPSANVPPLVAWGSAAGPTAIQAVVDAHDTATRDVSDPALAVDWIDQLIPFHRSANASVLRPLGDGPVVKEPTAVHAVAEMHDTPSRPTPSSWPEPEGVGVAWIDQLVPFHRSTNASTMPSLLVA